MMGPPLACGRRRTPWIEFNNRRIIVIIFASVSFYCWRHLSASAIVSMMKNDSSPLEPGTKVLVSRKGQARNTFLEMEEVGTVFGIGLEYAAGSAGMRNDGVLVKLQISNTRGIFSPTQVQRLEPLKSPDPSKRRSRRVRVTPSPSVLELVVEEAPPAPLEGASAVRKRNLDQVDGESSTEINGVVKTSKYFHAMEETSDDASTAMAFRVQRAPSPSSKCKECSQTIAKHFLRLQLTSQKRGWYHVACVKESFGTKNELPAVKDMEGYSELSPAEQLLLRIQLGGDEDSATAVDAMEEDESESVEDPPLVSLKNPTKKKRAAPKVARRKKIVLEQKGEDEEDGIEEDESESAEDPPLVSLKKPTTKKKAAPKVARRKKIVLEQEDEVEDGMLRASDTDSDDEKDMPYRVEYSATGRATCRGCDERIGKGLLRVAERPLFRGKPGFVVYRHLQCAIFPEEIERLQDVGGWRRLRKNDREAVIKRVEESKVLVEKENQEIQPDELVQVGFQGEIRSPPKGLSANLLPFQVEGVSWMVHQELHVPELRGGILADEMGMGKTLQTITTILDNRPKLQWAKPAAKHPPSAPDLESRQREEKLWKDNLDMWKFEMEKCNVPKKLIMEKSGKKDAPMGARAGTLVVCPVIALYQWREEIKKFTEENALSVCCYHGPNRAKEFPRELLCKYDVVLTTYQVIESDFRKMISPNKVKCPNCRGSYRIDKLKVHLKYFCGESAQRTEAQARQRRTADGPAGRGGRGNGGGNSGRGGNNKKKNAFKPQTKPKTKSKSKPKAKPKSKQKQKQKAVVKKRVRARSTPGYDSDSDLSVEADLDLNSPRPRRSAAASASKKLAASAKQWGDQGSTMDSDSDTDSDRFSAKGTSTSESSVGATKQKLARPGAKKSGKPGKKEDTKKPLSDDGFSSDDSGESSDDSSVEFKKQKVAPAKAKKGGKQGKMKGKKKPLPDDDSSSDESSAEDRDPMEGIDLDKLMKEAMEGSRVSSLHTLCWWRVVLDEAHMIKSRSSQTAAAAFALTSIHRWCLSGTPLQNRVGELYSLIRFLRIDPMAHYFCRKEGCDCKSVHYRMMNGKCLDCNHGTIQHYSHFNKHVLNPIQRAGYQGDGRRAMMKLKTDVLDKALIRRTKESRAEDMNLPPRVVNIKTVRLHPIEEDFYNALYTQTKSSFADYVTEGTLLNNYAHIFDLLTKMRQAVDHPYLIVFSKKNAGKFSAPGAPAVANGSIDCELCHEPPTDRIVSTCCGSAFCRSCVADYMSAALENLQEGTRCPTCRAPFSIDMNQESSDIVDDSTLTVGTGSATANMPSLKEMSHVSSGSILRRINLAEFATSTKVEALVQELVQMRQQRQGSKALVFSQFVNMLDLIRWRLHSDPCLQNLGLGVRIIHGGMNVQSRDEALKDFKNDPSVRILLMSLKAGGVALNLTVANEVYLMDPWWNPAAEMQAIDRTHRLGQYRPIRAVRFIAEGTVEERVLQLQEKKRLVFDGTVGRDAASLKMLTVEDMKAMFA